MLFGIALTRDPRGQRIHATQNDCPALGWYWPLGHGVHTEASVESENVPRAHPAQARFAVRLGSTLTYEPGAHRDTASQNVCAALGWNLPFGHSVQLEASVVLEKRPAGQPRHAVLPVTFWNWPGEPLDESPLCILSSRVFAPDSSFYFFLIAFSRRFRS